jgi:DNA processing protein
MLNLDLRITESTDSLDLPEDPTQRTLLELLSDEPAHIDVLYQLSGFPIQEIQAALSMLELQGAIKHIGGRHYLRLHDEPIKYCVD